jgi:hypothetical protein
LKKRSKKLLSVSGGTESSRFDPVRRAFGKSFLVLFFKKEQLSLPSFAPEKIIRRCRFAETRLVVPMPGQSGGG